MLWLEVLLQSLSPFWLNLIPSLKSLLASAEMLEAKNKEVQDIEFTIERGNCFYSKQKCKKGP